MPSRAQSKVEVPLYNLRELAKRITLHDPASDARVNAARTRILRVLGQLSEGLAEIQEIQATLTGFAPDPGKTVDLLDDPAKYRPGMPVWFGGNWYTDTSLEGLIRNKLRFLVEPEHGIGDCLAGVVATLERIADLKAADVISKVVNSLEELTPTEVESVAGAVEVSR